MRKYRQIIRKEFHETVVFIILSLVFEVESLRMLFPKYIV